MFRTAQASGARGRQFGASAVLTGVVLLLAGCGGASEVSAAASTTKQALSAHGTKYTSVECVEPTTGHFTCQAIGSNADPSFDSWCSVAFANGSIAAFDAAADCHWPADNLASRSTAPNNPVLTTPSRLGK